MQNAACLTVDAPACGNRVVESGEQRLDQWVSVRRNVFEDYKRAFGEEPGHIVAVGIMTDFGDNGEPL